MKTLQAYSTANCSVLKMQSWKHAKKKKKKAAALFPSRRPGASGLGKQSSSAGDPAPLQGHGCMFCGWESDYSLVHTQLISTLCPLFQLCLPCSPCVLPSTLGKPLPFITPQVKSHLDVSSALFSGSCCLGLGLRGGIQSYKAMPTLALA